ncbi:MAG: prepilin-type N-terminal cleavage/methylation domain-containing protein [Pseudohongiellaceae bacterium]
MFSSVERDQAATKWLEAGVGHLHKRVHSGYTIIELVIVIVILGIVSAVTISRLVRSDIFSDSVIRDQVISSVRSAHQNATGRVDSTLTLNLVSDELHFILEDFDGEIQRDRVAIDEVTIAGDVNQLASCANIPGANPLTSSDSIVFEFDTFGDLRRAGIEGSLQDVTTGARICVNDDPRYSVCISKTGYAYAGDCENGS